MCLSFYSPVIKQAVWDWRTLHTKTFNKILWPDDELKRTGQQMTSSQATHSGSGGVAWILGLLPLGVLKPKYYSPTFLKWDSLASLPRGKCDGHPWRHLTAIPLSMSTFVDFILVLIYTSDWADHTKLTHCFSHHHLSSSAFGNSASHSAHGCCDIDKPQGTETLTWDWVYLA